MSFKLLHFAKNMDEILKYSKFTMNIDVLVPQVIIYRGILFSFFLNEINMYCYDFKRIT